MSTVWNEIGDDPSSYGPADALLHPDLLTKVDASSTYQARNGADPGDTGHWLDYTPGVKILRARDRVFIGGTAGFSGDYAGSDNAYLLTARWLPVNSTVYAGSQVGRIALTGVSRANLSPAGPTSGPSGTQAAAIGVAGFTRQDKLVSDATRNVFAWGAYFEAEQASGAQGAFGVEIDVGNEGAASASNGPYSMYGIDGTWGLVVASGGSTGAPYASATAGLCITNNGSDFKTGIIIEKDAVAGTDGSTGTGTAIDLAKGHVVQWSTPEGAGLQGATLYSSVAANANRVGIELADSAIKFSRAGSIILRVGYNGGANNFLATLSSSTGNPVIVTSDSGSNSNVGLKIQPKGTGQVDLTDGVGVARVSLNQTGLGFFGTAPAAKPTGVAVTAAGIHAALVTLGLIAA